MFACNCIFCYELNDIYFFCKTQSSHLEKVSLVSTSEIWIGSGNKYMNKSIDYKQLHRKSATQQEIEAFYSCTCSHILNLKSCWVTGGSLQCQLSENNFCKYCVNNIWLFRWDLSLPGWSSNFHFLSYLFKFSVLEIIHFI